MPCHGRKSRRDGPYKACKSCDAFSCSERRDRAVSSPLGNVESVWRDPPRALIFSKAMRFGPKESCEEMDLNWFSGGFTAQSCEHGTACPCHFA